MPKINIDIKKIEADRGSQELLIVYSDSVETKHYSKILNFKKIDSFKIEELLPEDLAAKIQAVIEPSGLISINKVSSDLGLSVTTYGSCNNHWDLNLSNLSITANILSLAKTVSVKNNLELNITERFNNHAAITANHCRITTNGTIHNLRSLVGHKRLEILEQADFINEGLCGTTEGRFTYQGHSITNSGILDVYEAKVILYKRDATEKMALFSNHKLFIVRNKLYLEDEKTLINTGNLIIGLEASFKLAALYNKGKIAVNGKCYIDAKKHITNKQHGDIVATDRLRLSFRTKLGKIINLGNIAADRIAIRDCCDFTNDVNAIILARELELFVASLFFNAGMICGKEKCDLALLTIKETNAINTSNGTILSNQKINLVVKDNLTNYGKITGHKGVSGTFFGSLFNLSTGSINSEALLSLKAIAELVNTAEISGAQTKVSTPTLDNQQGGYIYGTEVLSLNGEFIENAGKLFSGEKVDVNVGVLIKNLHSGIIQAAEKLTLVSGLKIKNSGLLQSDQTVSCQVKDGGLFTNTSLGTITAQQADIVSQGITNSGNVKVDELNAESRWLFNRGEINAHVLKAAIQGIFRNLQQGVIHVDTLAKIITENNFDNLGVLFSDQKLEIIGKEVCNYIDAELYAEHFLYLEAINLFSKGEIKSAADLMLLVKENFEYENAVLEANGELSLTLKNGSQVKYNLNTPGDLKFEFLTAEGTWYNNSQIQSGKDLTINVPGHIIINGQFNRNALIHAQETLHIRAKQIEITQGSLLATHLDLDSQYNITIKEDGTIAGIEGDLYSESSVEQYGKIEFLKNLSIMAKKAYSHRGSVTLVGGDLAVEVDQWILEGFTKIDGELNAKVIDFHLSQYANTLQVPVIYNGSVGQVTVSIQQADPASGLLQAKKITLSCEKFTQLGGTIKSGPGGTYIEIKGDAFLEGLRTTHIWQGAISAEGRNYAIVPVFVPATIESEGDLTVTANGKLVGASIELKAIGIKEITAKSGISITQKYEHYDPPEYRQPKKKKRFGGVFSIAISAFASCFVGPAACSLMGITGATTLAITSAAIGGAVSAALSGGRLKDIFKGAAIGAITAGVMDKLKIQLPAAAKGKDLTVKASQNALRTTAAANNMLKHGVQTGVSTAVNGKGKLDIMSLIGSGVAGFSGASIDSKLNKSLFESAIRTGAVTAAHGGKVVHNFTVSAAEAIGSYLGEQAGSQIASKMEEQRKSYEIKKALQQQEQAANQVPLASKPHTTLSEPQWECLTEEQQLEQLLLQGDKENLKNKVGRELAFHVRRYAALGRSFDIQAVLSGINERIDAIDSSAELKQFEQKFMKSSLKESSLTPSKTQLAIFESSGNIENKPEQVSSSSVLSQANKFRHYQFELPGPKSFLELYETTSSSIAKSGEANKGASSSNSSTSHKSWNQQYGEILLEDAQHELDSSTATLGVAAGIVTGTAKLVVGTGELLYKVVNHAAKVNLLNNPEYVGVLSEETRIRLQQEINQDHEAVHAVLDPVVKNPRIIGKAIVTHFQTQLKEVDVKLKQGDYFGAGKQSGEMLVDVATTVSGGYGAAKTGIGIASKLSVRALDLAGDSLVAASKMLPPQKSLLTFQHELYVAKATRNVAIKAREIRATGHPIIPKEASNVIKSIGGENTPCISLSRVGAVELPCKLPKNQGLDGVFVQKTADGSIEKIFIVESKYSATGELKLSQTKGKGLQMSEPWIEKTLRTMEKSADPEIRATAKLIRDNPGKILYKANVLRPNGINKWYSLTPTENGVIINNPPRAPPPKPRPK